MIGFPFDSHVTHDSDGQPSFDRAITSEPYRKLLKELFKTGFLASLENCFLVEEAEGLTVKVNPGFAMVEGCMKLEEDERTLAVQSADSSYDRIDTVVLRLDDNDSVRACDLYIVEGTPAITPVRPALTRTNSIYELGLADLFISKNSTSIPAFKITDTRYDSSRCGVVSSISEFNTTGIYNQIQEDLAYFKNVEEAEFDAWFETIRDKLDGDTAGHLQNEIDEINADLTDVVKYKNSIEMSTPVPRDADTLGGQYSASDITTINNNLTYFNVDTKKYESDKFRVAKNGEGKVGYLGADDSFIPFKSGLELGELICYGAGATGVSQTWIKTVDYKTLNIDSFKVTGGNNALFVWGYGEEKGTYTSLYERTSVTANINNISVPLQNSYWIRIQMNAYTNQTTTLNGITLE